MNLDYENGEIKIKYVKSIYTPNVLFLSDKYYLKYDYYDRKGKIHTGESEVYDGSAGDYDTIDMEEKTDRIENIHIDRVNNVSDIIQKF